MEAKLGLIIDESNPFQKMDSENGNERKDALIEESDQQVDGVEHLSKSEITDEAFFDNVGDEEKKFYEESGYNPDDIENMNIQCTACWKQVNHRITNAIVRHPMLGVPICRTCKNFYGEENEWTKDDEGFDCFCRWCGNGGDLICCDKCTKSFCKRCIQRNKGRSKIAEITGSAKWECFSCSPSQIYDIRALFYAIFKWSSSFQMKEQEKSSKKRLDKMKKAREERMLKIKEAEETNKIENFIDENINEAFDTLEIYQKCLETEKKKWLKSRKCMNANNAAVTARNLRRIYAITRQNMDLLDTALVQAYGGLYPEEDENKLKYGKIPGDSKIPQADISFNKTPRSTSKKRQLSAMLNSTDVDKNEEGRKESSDSGQKTMNKPKEINDGGQKTIGSGQKTTYKPKDINGSGQKTINKPKEINDSGQETINKPKLITDSGQKTINKSKESGASSQKTMNKPKEINDSGQKTIGSGQKTMNKPKEINDSGQKTIGSVQKTMNKPKDINGSGQKTINKPKEITDSGQKTINKPGESSHKTTNKPKGKIQVSTNLFKKSPSTTQKKKRRKPFGEVTLEVSDESDSEMKTKSQANSGRKKRKSSSEFDVSFTFE